MHALLYAALLLWAFGLINIILNLLFLGKLRGATLDRYPLVSIIVPARNEERAIERTVRAMLAQDYPELEVIVVNDRSSDSTGAILDRVASEDSRLVAVHGEEPPPDWLGKPWALHQGSLRARGELLLFVDADVHYAPAAVSTAVQHNEATHQDLTFLFPNFEMHGLWENALMPAVPMTPFTVPIWLGERLPYTYLAIGGGTGNLIRRAAYDKAGGHAALRDAVIDDVGLAHHVRRSGSHTGIARTEHLVSVRMYHGFREVVNGFTKNVFTIVGRSYLGAAFFLSIFIVGSLLPFAMALTGNRVAIATVALIILSRLIFFAGVGYPLWSAVLLHPLTAVGWMWITIRSTWVVGIRGQLPWRGRTYDPNRTRFGADR
ncbi:MAG TPA: glycosyltransferase [Thermoanaerobaculia bacterium]